MPNGGAEKIVRLSGAGLLRGEIIASVVMILLGVVACLIRQSDPWQGIGASLIAGGLIALVVFVVYGETLGKRARESVLQRTELLKEIKRSTEQLETLNEVGRVAWTVGLEGYDKRRDDLVIERAVREAKDRVDILEVSLDTMHQMNADDWKACQARVRIILLDPVFPRHMPLAQLRDDEEQQHSGQILDEIRKTLRLLPSDWMADNGSRATRSEARVKLAQLMPTMSYFRIDNSAYYAPLVHQRVGHRTMHLRFRKEGAFFDALAANFEELWNDADKVKPASPSSIPRHYSSRWRLLRNRRGVS